ncbi:cytochrome P450 [Streptomyces chumphonensis]|uniref:cytochrome P450 n=1 Tax=Streptomyces chumphonensis TaxID=1214925 RepID=UPI003D71C48F
MSTVNTPAREAVPAASLPGPRSPMLYQGLKLFRDPASFMRTCRERYGKRFELKIMPKGSTIYVISDPDEVKAMFLAPRTVLHTGNGSAALEKFIGQTGLAWLDEEEHKARRKQILPSIKGDAHKRIEASVGEMAERIVATWPRGEVVALYPYIHRFTIQVIREVVFGKAVPSCWDELFEVVWDMLSLNRRISSMIETHTMSPFAVKVLRAVRPLGLDRFFKNRARADALIAQAVRERMDSGEFGDDMLSVMLGITREDGSPLSAVELRDEIMTMFLAGTETTSAAICWALECLSREPAALERLVAEIDAGEGDTYLTGTVHEVLRMYPPTPQIIPREVMKPIEIGGVRYEPGAHLWASGYLVHHDPEIYPEPDRFRPERWEGVKPSAHTWIPFGGGHTRCLGDRIAILEMKAVLREVLSTCALHREDMKPEGPRSRTVTMTTRQGTRLALRPRADRADRADLAGHPAG